MSILGNFKKQHKVIVMDGTNKKSLGEIIGIIGMLAYGNGRGRFTYRQLDEQHPSIYVVEFKSNLNEFSNIIDLLDERHPGLCIYDVAV